MTIEPLAQAGIERLDLGFEVATECDARGNCGVQRASFEHANGVGELGIGFALAVTAVVTALAIGLAVRRLQEVELRGETA